MAFQPLTDVECGQKNSLLRLASHVTQDQTFSENHGHLFPNSSDQLVEQFLQETKCMPQTFRMDELMREMHEIESQKSAVPPIPASTVKDQLHDDAAWAQQYIEAGNVFYDNIVNESIWADIATEENLSKENNWTVYNHPQQQVAGPSSLDDNVQEIYQAGGDDSKFVYSKFMKFMKRVAGDDINLEDTKLTEEEAQAWSQEFLTNNNKAEEDLLNDSWKNTQNENDFNSKFWDHLQEEFKEASKNEQSDQWASEFDSFYTSPYKDYAFTDDNPMFDVNDPLERGKQLLKEGDLPSAVLCFEAAVKQDSDNAEAWLLLGKTQAENEQDPNAIPALIKCLQLEPHNLAAMMALAVCYTNESYYNQAAKTLLSWLSNNPKYSDLIPAEFKLSGQVTSFIDPDEQKVVQNLFIKAALRQPNDIDYEVQCGLGVLFNLSGEYDKAADCFRAALSVKEDDARLWNRLGATLANGSKSEEAVEAYHQALSLEPGFIRARYNVGIICINLQAYKEAVEHFLTALNQQARGKDVMNSDGMSQMSNTIWSTLRMCVSLMNRSDLKEAVDNRDLQLLNIEFGISS